MGVQSSTAQSLLPGKIIIQSVKTFTMKEFMLLFRVPGFVSKDVSPAEFQVLAKKWNDWIQGIASQGKLVSGPGRLAHEGKVLKPGGVITDGPFVEIKERLGGYIVVNAESLDEATTLAHGCPALEQNGSVEVRGFLNI